MANAANKKMAASNLRGLKRLHTVSLAVNSYVLLSYFVFNRPANLKPYMFLSSPALFLEWFLDKSSRPKHDSRNGLISAGTDLKQSGLTENFFDVIYVTWFCAVLSAITGRTWIWYLYMVVPGYATYLLISLLLKLKGAFRGGAKSSTPSQPVKSKRQEKLEKRGDRVQFRS